MIVPLKKYFTFIVATSLFLFVSCAEKREEVYWPLVDRTPVAHADDDDGIFNNALYYYEQQDYSRSLSEIRRLRTDDMTPEFRDRVLWLLGNLQFETGSKSRSIETLLSIVESSEDRDIKSRALVSLLSNIDKMEVRELRSEDGRHELIQPHLLFTLGEKYMQQGDHSSAKATFIRFVSEYPGHEYTALADQYILRMDSLENVDPNTIGIILPLSGPNAPFGLKSLQGMQLALGVFGNKGVAPGKNVRLAVMDSQGDPEVARIAVDRLIEEDNVIAIIGPLETETSYSVARQCALYGIPNINLSQRQDLDGLGSYIFKIGMTRINQVRRLVSYAMDDLSIKNFGILYPEDSYGEQFSQLFWDEVLSRGGQVNVVESYPSDQADFRDSVKKLLGLYYIDSRRTEYEDIRAELEEKTGRSPRARDIDRNLPPVISFDALFVPDDARAVAQIAPYLPYYNARNIVLMGPSTWNSPQLVSRGRGHVEGTIFVDGFYPYPRNKEGKRFVNEFRTVFDMEPGILEAQAYDAVSILVDVIFNRGNTRRESVARAILRSGPYENTTSRINFSESGEAEKDLFVLGVERGRIVLKE